jgi:hypothetical protein
MDNGRLRPNYPGKFVGVERLVRATQWSEPIDQPNLGGVARIFAPQSGANGANNRCKWSVAEFASELICLVCARHGTFVFDLIKYTQIIQRVQVPYERVGEAH